MNHLAHTSPPRTFKRELERRVWGALGGGGALSLGGGGGAAGSSLGAEAASWSMACTTPSFRKNRLHGAQHISLLIITLQVRLGKQSRGVALRTCPLRYSIKRWCPMLCAAAVLSDLGHVKSPSCSNPAQKCLSSLRASG